MNTLLYDLRFSARNLRRTPGFTIAALVALGLGIGATTTIFSLVDGVVLRPLPYREPDRLVMLWETNEQQSLLHEPLSPVNFLDYRQLHQAFTDAAAWWRPNVSLVDPDREAIRVNAVEAGANFFSVLGVGPRLGPGFPPEPMFDREPVVVISDWLWRTRFAADPALIGKTINLNGTQYAVVGVMGAGFHFPGDTDVWQRSAWDFARHSRAAHFMEAIARLAPGATVERAGEELAALTGRLQREFAATNRGWSARPVRLDHEVVGYYRPALFVLLGAVGVLLLIACLDVASLLLVRASARAREVAVRAAIGATRSRLVRQFLTESLLLALAGSGLGFVTAAIGVRTIVAASPLQIPRLDEVTVDLRVLGFAVAAGAATAVIFGLLPALLMSKTDLLTRLKEGARQSGGHDATGSHRLLVVAQVALAVVLLSGAGLLVRSVAKLASEDPGFASGGILTANIQLTGRSYQNWPEVDQFYAHLLETLRERPDIVSAGASNFLPLAPGWRIPFLVRGRPTPPRDETPTAQYHSVSDGYFETLGVPLLKGRSFDTRDSARTQGVAVINETLARQHFAGEDPIGRTLASLTVNIGPLGRSLMESRDHLIIGVVGDVRNTSLQRETEPAIYHSTRQFPFRSLYLVVRGHGETAALVASVRETLRGIDPTLPLAEVRPLADVIAATVDQPRHMMYVMSLFAAFALGLAVLGLYALLSYAVARRQREISVRIALGAQRASVLWLILRQGLWLASAGVGLGLVGAYNAMSLLQALLFGVTPTDVATLASVSALLLVVACGASLVPARRAAAIDPLQGLRIE